MRQCTVIVMSAAGRRGTVAGPGARLRKPFDVDHLLTWSTLFCACRNTPIDRSTLLHVDVDDRVLGDLIAAVGLASDEDSQTALLARLKQFQLGWSVEQRFAALSLWFGRCTLIHFLDQEKQLPQSSVATYRVPDLLGVYSVGNREIPVLVEVKGSYRLHLGPEYPGTTLESRRNRLNFAHDTSLDWPITVGLSAFQC